MTRPTFTRDECGIWHYVDSDTGYHRAFSREEAELLRYDLCWDAPLPGTKRLSRKGCRWKAVDGEGREQWITDEEAAQLATDGATIAADYHEGEGIRLRVLAGRVPPTKSL